MTTKKTTTKKTVYAQPAITKKRTGNLARPGNTRPIKRPDGASKKSVYIRMPEANKLFLMVNLAFLRAKDPKVTDNDILLKIINKHFGYKP